MWFFHLDKKSIHNHAALLACKPLNFAVGEFWINLGLCTDGLRAYLVRVRADEDLECHACMIGLSLVAPPGGNKKK